MMEDEKVESHPSYGMISACHTSSNGAVLFGSEFRHHHFIELTIRVGERHRHHSHDWYYGGRELISVFLSEAQFVEMIARPNTGSGVPCTIKHVMGEGRPDPPDPEPLSQRFNSDVKEKASECVRQLRRAHELLNGAIESGWIGKTALRDISATLRHAVMDVEQNIPYVEKSFRESMENVVHHAAVEIEATVAATAMRLGLDEMRAICARAPKMIEGSAE